MNLDASQQEPTRPPMRVALVAMPWSRRDRPSGAIGALAAYLRRERPKVDLVCRSEYVELARRIGYAFYDDAADHAYEMGELLYTPLLYPEKQTDLRRYFEEWAPEHLSPTSGMHQGSVDWGGTFDRVVKALRVHVEVVADEIVAGHDVVGLTTSFGQLFANLALCEAIKRRAPRVLTFLGGSTVSARVGPSVLSEYPFVDFIVQGEGELPLIALVDAVSSGDPESAASNPGILSRNRAAQHPNGVALSEVPRMDELPFPDYDEYVERAEELGIDWWLPVEGSRGCWWDRTKRTGDPMKTCHFCNLNVQWGGYREKSIPRLVGELDALSERYQELKIYTLDNIIRSKGVVDLAEALSALGKDFWIFYEMRANVQPLELVALWEAGLRAVQFGIEGLSTSFLRRINKGTTLLQNLSVMRTCAELGIYNGANLIVDYPGSTAEEVSETCDAIASYALSFEPLRTSRFNLGVDSTMDALRERFGVVDVRNRDSYRHALPDEVYHRLHLFDLSFSFARPMADWSPVKEACKRWASLHERPPGPQDRGRAVCLLQYRDGGSFIVIEDARFGDFRSGTFTGFQRDLYLYCLEIRTREQMGRRFAGRASTADIDDALAQFVEHKIAACEDDRYLALAVAVSPQLAARRIRAAAAEREPGRAEPRRLAIAAVSSDQRAPSPM
jgi:ribosomal peptide maturation radical SAM protein 1